MKRVLVTGAAGFIGSNLVERLLSTENEVEIVGLDSVNDYYDITIKDYRLANISKVAQSYPQNRWHFVKGNIADKVLIDQLFADYDFDVVVNLAAQAGVRYSITNPDAYIESNIIGFYNILEACRHSYDGGASGVQHLVYASSSSVYGSNKKVPYSTDDKVDNPVSLYAATKKSNELMAHSYTHLYGFQTLGFRFFTVYGPWGRPDMAAWLFSDAMSQGRSIKVFNNGEMYRDFTYIDDIVDGLVRCIESDSLPLYDVYNIGNHRSERLLDMINIIAKEIGVENPKMEFLPMQDGDVPSTYANIDKLNAAVGYEPTTPISVGMPRFVKWFKEWKRNNP